MNWVRGGLTVVERCYHPSACFETSRMLRCVACLAGCGAKVDSCRFDTLKEVASLIYAAYLAHAEPILTWIALIQCKLPTLGSQRFPFRVRQFFLSLLLDRGYRLERRSLCRLDPRCCPRTPRRRGAALPGEPIALRQITLRL